MFTELEYKYDAKDVSWSAFEELMMSLCPTRVASDSSWDLYYTKTDDPNDFQRFRMGLAPELTRKVKTSEVNNKERIEVDLPLAPGVSETVITKYVGLAGYEPSFKIYKTFQVYWVDSVNYSYYIVYDEEMKELDRFIEVEINKNEVSSMLSPQKVLDEGEKRLKSLGITPQNRKKKSLFEIYKKV